MTKVHRPAQFDWTALCADVQKHHAFDVLISCRRFAGGNSCNSNIQSVPMEKFFSEINKYVISILLLFAGGGFLVKYLSGDELESQPQAMLIASLALICRVENIRCRFDKFIHHLREQVATYHRLVAKQKHCSITLGGDFAHSLFKAARLTR